MFNPYLTMAAAMLGLQAFALAKTDTLKVQKGSPEIFIKKIDAKEALPDEYQATRTSYFVHIPDGYEARRAYPLILAISPGDGGRDMFGTFQKAAQTYDLFFACPDQAGNSANLAIRGQKAVDTLADVRARYNIDPKQIYVTGFSGGGRMSTAMVYAFPGLFAGHMPIGGIDFNGKLAPLKTTLGHYIFAGEKCFNRPESEAALKTFQDAGVPAALLIGPGLEHAAATPDQGLKMYEWFHEKAMKVVSDGLQKEWEAAGKFEDAGQWGKALRAYEAIAAQKIKHQWVEASAAKVKALTQKGESDLAEAKKLPGPDACLKLDRLIRYYEDTAIGKQASEAREAIAKDPKTIAELDKRRKEARLAEAQKALAGAEASEKSGKFEVAIAAYQKVAKDFADTDVAATATAAAQRLNADPKVNQAKQDAAAERLLRKAENYQRNNMATEAAEALKELIAKFPGSKAAESAKKDLEALK